MWASQAGSQLLHQWNAHPPGDCSKKGLFRYLKGWVTERRRHKENQTSKTGIPIGQFTSQMNFPRGCNQHPELPCRSRVPNTWPISCCFARHMGRELNYQWIHQDSRVSTPLWDAGITSCDLTHYATMPGLHLHVMFWDMYTLHNVQIRISMYFLKH